MPFSTTGKAYRGSGISGALKVCSQDSKANQFPKTGPMIPLPKPSLATRLLLRGHRMEVAGGRLVVTPLSGQPAPGDWLNRHYAQMTSDVARQLGGGLYLYESYSTGRFNKGRLKGVQLQFTCAVTRESRFVIFNAEIERQRNTKHGRSGAILPRNQFKAGKKSAFANFWQSAGLPQPQRKGWYGNHMGTLKGMIFTGVTLAGEKLDKHSLRPLSISQDELRELFGLSSLNNAQTKSEQDSDKSQTLSPNTNILETQLWQRVQPEPTTGPPNYGNTVVRERGNKVTPKSPIEQTHEEWLEDYEDTPTRGGAINFDAGNQGRGAW